jgi:hypothetical protein
MRLAIERRKDQFAHGALGHVDWIAGHSIAEFHVDEAARDLVQPLGAAALRRDGREFAEAVNIADDHTPRRFDLAAVLGNAEAGVSRQQSPADPEILRVDAGTRGDAREVQRVRGRRVQHDGRVYLPDNVDQPPGLAALTGATQAPSVWNVMWSFTPPA